MARWTLAILLSVGLLTATAMGPAAAAGAGAARATPSAAATLTVSPASPVAVGDTITVSGTGLAPASQTLSGGVWVHGCRSGITVGDGREELQDYCSGELGYANLPIEGGDFSATIEVTAPWDVV